MSPAKKNPDATARKNAEPAQESDPGKQFIEKLLARYAEDEELEDLCYMGNRYKYGKDGYPKDDVEAVKYYSQAAERGHAEAQVELGQCCQHGTGVVKDEAAAVEWFRKAAGQQEPPPLAQFLLGDCYLLGTGVAQDNIEAAKCYRKAAEEDFSAAQCSLGDCYAKGQGVLRDPAEAMKWWFLAAEQGDPEAQARLEKQIKELKRRQKLQW